MKTALRLFLLLLLTATPAAAQDDTPKQPREIRGLRRLEETARAYQPQIAPKWIAADGKSFWLVWTDFQVFKKDGRETRPHYVFNVRKVEVLTDAPSND